LINYMLYDVLWIKICLNQMF